MKPHMYLQLVQKGGSLPVYRGHRIRGGRLSLGFLKPLGKFIGKTALSLSKSLVKKAGPKLLQTAQEVGTDVLSGKSSIKDALRKTARASKRALMTSARDTINERLVAGQKGGRRRSLRRKRKGATSSRNALAMFW